MMRRCHLRGGSALVIVFFATTTVSIPVVEGAELTANVQRYGVDQDGNVVVLTPQPAAVETVPQQPALPAAPLPASRSVRYGLNQSGEPQPLPEAPPAPAPPAVASAPSLPASERTTAAPGVVAPPAAEHRSAGAVPTVPPPAVSAVAGAPEKPGRGVVASLSARLKGTLAALSRWTGILMARVSPAPATATPYRSAAPRPAAPAAKGSTPAVTAAPSPKPSPVAAVPPPQKQAAAASLSVSNKPVPSPESRVPISHSAVPGPRSLVPAFPRYSLKIDSLAVRAAARPVEKKLAQNGVAILKATDDRADVTVHRLVVGTFATREEAQECLAAVQPKLHKAYLMSHNGTHGVFCGSYFSLKKAEEKAAELKGTGVRLSIRRDSVEMKRTTLLAGSFISRDAARDISRRLRQMGIPAVIVSESETLAETGSGRGTKKA